MTICIIEIACSFIKYFFLVINLPMTNAERQKAYRERQKLLKSNVTVTAVTPAPAQVVSSPARENTLHVVMPVWLWNRLPTWAKVRCKLL